jgi:hypothetical protein
MPRRDDTLAAPVLPAPRFAAGWAALTYLVCTLALGYPALAGMFLINPRSDQYLAGYAFREFAAQSLKAGHGFPQWNPYLMGGLPYIAAMHGDIFYPTFLLRMIMPTDMAMTWEFIIHLFLAGVFTYGFLRAWGFGFYGALLGGVAYMISGQLASFASPGHDGKLFVSTLLPLALWLLVLGIRDGRRLAWGLLALTIGLAVLSPHPQLFQYLLLASGAFALFVAFSDNEGRGAMPRPVAIRRLGLALGSVVLGSAMGAVQFMPLREYLPWSPRAGGHENFTAFSMPVEEVFNTYLPQFTGILTHYWGRNSIHFHSEYLGVAVLILAGAAFGATSRKTFRNFWLGTFIVSLLWALGGNTPFYQLVYVLVPGTKYFQAPSTMLFLVSFACAMLAAVGMERVISRRVSTRYAMGWLIGAGVIALLASAGMLTNMAETIASSFRQDGYEAAAANSGALLLGAWRSFVVAAAAAGLLYTIALEKIALRSAVTGLIALTAVDLLSIDYNYWIFSPPASKIFASDAAVAYLHQQAQPGRVVALPLSEQGLVDHDPFLEGDALMGHGIRLTGNYHGDELGRYQKLGNRDARWTNCFSPAFWRLENVRYFYTTVDEATLSTFFAQQLKLPNLTFTRLAGPLRDAAGSMVYLLGVPGDNPYAWLAPAAVKAPDDQALATVLDARFDPSRVAIFDTADKVVAPPLSALPAALSVTTSVTAYAPGHVSLKLSAPAPAGAFLVVSENYYPGWHATVDTKPVTVSRADYNLMGLSLPTGATNVDLNFEDAAYDSGKKVTLIALLLTLLVIAGGVASDRMRRD